MLIITKENEERDFWSYEDILIKFYEPILSTVPSYSEKYEVGYYLN
jgi:hypothetical protein